MTLEKMECSACSKVWYVEEDDAGTIDSCPFCGSKLPQKPPAVESLVGVELLQNAAEQGGATAQYNLGIACANGDGVKQDYRKAVEWFQKAAEQGHKDAPFNLGGLLLQRARCETG